MTVYNGKNGSVAFATSTILGSATNSWQVTTLADIAGATNMGDVWESDVVGLTDFNGSVDADSSIGADYPQLLVDQNTADAGEVVTFTVVSGGPNLSGTMLITGISETASIEDIGKLSVTLEGSDEDGLVLAAT